MSMKKIIAGVAAAALTVGSLAVVGVSADETKTFNFVGLDGTMNISYSETIGFRGGIEPGDLFALTTNPSSYDFTYGLKLSMKSGYKDDNLGDVNNALSGIKTSGGTKITVTGTNKAGRTISTSCTTKVVKENDKPVKETFNVRWEGDNGKPTLVAEDLDLTYFETITAIEASTSFAASTSNFYVPEGVCDVAVTNDLRLEDARVDMNGSGSYKSESKDNNGYIINAGKIYTFEGVRGKDSTILDNEGWKQDYEWALGGTSLGGNLLRWTNDNIVQNKGAKLRINFMTPNEMKSAIQGGSITTYPTTANEDAKWQGSTVLVPESNTSTSTQDIVIGVNLQNTTKLQQTTNIVNYTAEFDWDSLVQNSAATVSGNVDSIAFRINEKSSNVKDNVADKDGNIAIKSIEIVIPEQQEAANEPTRILTAGSGDTFVKVIGTDKTIFGNGAQELAVDNSITANNVKYSLKLTDANGAYVQPAGELTLQLSIPADFRGKTLSSSTVRHTCNDGTVEELAIQNMDTYKTDNYIVVKTSKFSSFDFGFETEATEATTEAPAETTTEAPVETTTEAPAETTAPVADTNNGGADKNANTGVVLAVVPAAIAAAAVVISKKRK